MKLPNLESRSAPALETMAQLSKRRWNAWGSFNKYFSWGNTLASFFEVRVWKCDFSRQFWRFSSAQVERLDLGLNSGVGRRKYM